MTRHDYPGHRKRRRTTTALTAAVLTVALAASACTGGDEEPETGEPPETSTSTPTQTPTPTPTKDPDAWRAKFKPAQLEAYDTALQRWEEYEARAEPIWSKGEAVPAAEKLFKEYFPHPVWRSYWERLKTYEQVEVKVDGTPAVFWSRAKSISGNGRSVQILQCVDYTTVKGTQRGKPTVRSRWMEKPQLRTIYLSQPDRYDWLIYGVVDTSEGKSRPCTP